MGYEGITPEMLRQQAEVCRSGPLAELFRGAADEIERLREKTVERSELREVVDELARSPRQPLAKTGQGGVDMLAEEIYEHFDLDDEPDHPLTSAAEARGVLSHEFEIPTDEIEIGCDSPTYWTFYFELHGVKVQVYTNISIDTDIPYWHGQIQNIEPHPQTEKMADFDEFARRTRELIAEYGRELTEKFSPEEK